MKRLESSEESARPLRLAVTKREKTVNGSSRSDLVWKSQPRRQGPAATSATPAGPQWSSPADLGMVNRCTWPSRDTWLSGEGSYSPRIRPVALVHTGVSNSARGSRALTPDEVGTWAKLEEVLTSLQPA